MAEFTLGGQNFTSDNPVQVLGLLDNLMRVKMAQDEQNRALTERSRVLEELQRYNIVPPRTAPQSFEELGRDYQGAVSGGEGEFPTLRPMPAAKPQVSNLRQLADVIQGLKGLPSEYAGQIVSRLTGIPDQSQAQQEAIIKLRAALSAPEKEAAREQKSAQAEATQRYRDEQLNLAKDKQSEQRFRRVQILSQALGQTLDPALKQRLSQMYLSELLSLSGEAGAEDKGTGINAKWTKK